jgi:hypothetical protein
MQQDYILRMIQQLSGFISGMMQLRKSGKSTESIEMIQDAIGRYSGLSATLVHAISDEDLIQLLRARGGIDADRAWALAELLREEALAYDSLGNADEAEPRYTKALRLYLEVLDEVEEMPSVLNVDGLEEIVDRIADLELTRSTRLRLVDYFVDTARFDRAENVVLWSLESRHVNRSTVEDAVGFYNSMLRLTPVDLERGGLPHDEVEHGFDQVTAMKNEFALMGEEE